MYWYNVYLDRVYVFRFFYNVFGKGMWVGFGYELIVSIVIRSWYE